MNLSTAHTDPHAHHGMAAAEHDHGAIGRNSELHFKVDGMHCASCAATVQKALEDKPGVESAAVNVIDGRATVTGHDLDADALVRAIRETGYEARLIEELAAPAELRSLIEVQQLHYERQWKRRAIIGLGFWIPLEILHWFGHAAEAHSMWIGWVLFIGSTIAFALVGGGFYQSAWGAAKRLTTNMDTLIAMGATTAYVYSLIVFIGQLMGKFHDQPLYFAEGAALLGIISLGHWMEARATAKAGSAVRELLELQPDTAELIQEAASDDRREEGAGDGDDSRRPHLPRSSLRPRSSDAASSVKMIPSADVKPGDQLLIRPGGRVPVDGVVVDGESEVDEAVVTGESLPVRKHGGDRVVAGSMNTTGRLIIKAEVDGRHTTISRIAEMVQRAQSSKADIQKLADRVSAIFVPTVLTIALVTLAGWWIAGDFSKGVISTVTVLIISCPCALGLATPMAVMVGAGAASRRGILVKSAMALETAGRATHVIFDKTGTLTAGKAVVTAIEERTVSGTVFLPLAAAVESPSEHPIARAIVDEAKRRGLTIPPVSNFAAIPGEGVRGVVNGKNVTVIRDERATCRVEVDGEIAGTITVADTLRRDARPAIDQLRRMGMTVMMLSGDRRAIAETIGAELGLSGNDIVAEATPEAKNEFVARMSGPTQAHDPSVTRSPAHSPTPAPPARTKPQAAPAGNTRAPGGVIMVGDGINDAAALAKADLGIAMASGTNIAIESADVVIPGDRVAAVADTVYIARATLRTIKQNLFFAFFYNAVAIPAAALGLLGAIGPIVAAAAMGLSDITVIGNAIRLKGSLGRRK
jgi:Cu+-exporting ATPase